MVALCKSRLSPPNRYARSSVPTLVCTLARVNVAPSRVSGLHPVISQSRHWNGRTPSSRLVGLAAKSWRSETADGDAPLAERNGRSAVLGGMFIAARSATIEGDVTLQISYNRDAYADDFSRGSTGISS